MSIANAITLTRNADFQDASLLAFVKVARDVIANAVNETPASLALAFALVKDPSNFKSRCTYVLVGDPTIYVSASLPSDATLITAAQNAWPYVAKLL